MSYCAITISSPLENSLEIFVLLLQEHFIYERNYLLSRHISAVLTRGAFDLAKIPVRRVDM